MSDKQTSQTYRAGASMHNCLQTFSSNVCVCVISSMGSLNRAQKRDWRGSQRHLSERQGSQLIETLKKIKEQTDLQMAILGKLLLVLEVQKITDLG